MQDIEKVKIDKISNNIEQWKRKLLDFTRRNNLIYFKYNKKVNLKICNECNEIFNSLIEENKNLIINDLKLDFEQTDEDKKLFDKVVSKLRSKANFVLREKGINTLYLCLGILKWRESEESSINIYSPLLLLPVQIIRTGKNRPFILTSVDNEFIVNSTLMYKMRMDFGIEIYSNENYSGNIENLLSHVKEQIAEIDSWDVIDDAYLGIFAFNKISMYKDLEKYEKKIYDHEIVSKLASGENIYSSSDIDRIDKIELDKKSQDIYQVLDADSSQHKTLVTAKKGYSFVIEGPPGTGKSQTISNIIAEAISQDKKVLFVSEKVAALEVVANRLNSVGLGDYILEIHSSKANKKQVISNIYSQYVRRKRYTKSNNDIFFNELDNNTEKLNEYVGELHKKYKPLEKSAFDLHGELAKLSNVTDLHYTIEDSNNLNIDRIIKMRNIVKELEYKHKHLDTYKKSSWKDISLNECNLQTQKMIETILYDLKRSLENKEKSILDIEREYGIEIKSVKDLFILKYIIQSLDENTIYLKSYFNENDGNLINELISINKSIQINFNKSMLALELIYSDNNFIRKYEIEKKVLDGLEVVLNPTLYQSLADKNVFNKAYETIDQIIETLKEINNTYDFSFDIFGENVGSSFDKIEIYIMILENLPKGGSIPSEWINSSENLNNIREIIVPSIKKESKTLVDRINFIKLNFREDIFRLDKELFSKTINFCLENKENDRAKDLYQSTSTTRQELKKIEECIKSIDSLTNDILVKLNINTTPNFQNFNEIELLVGLIDRTRYFNKSWFDNNQILILKNMKDKIAREILNLNKKRQEISDIFTESIYTLDYIRIYKDFSNKYSNKLRFLNSDYKKDKKNIERCLINLNKDISYEILLSNLEKLVIYEKEKEKFQKVEESYIETFGPLINGVYTDLEELERTVDNVEKIIYIWNKYGRSKEVIDFAINEKPQHEIIELSEQIKIKKDLYSSILENLNNFYKLDISFNFKTFKEQYDDLITINGKLNEGLKLFDTINNFINSNKVDFNYFIEYIKEILDLINDLELLKSKEKEYREIFGEYYCGLNTNWNTIERLLDFSIIINKLSENITPHESENLYKYILFKLDDNKLDLVKDVDSLKAKYQVATMALNNFIQLNKNDDKVHKVKQLDIESMITFFCDLHENLKIMRHTITNLSSIRNEKFISTEELKKDINTINLAANCIEKIRDIELENLKVFDSLYKGLNTDWKSIEKDFDCLKEVIEFAKKNNITITDKFVNKLCKPECVKLLKEIIYNIDINNIQNLTDKLLMLQKKNEILINEVPLECLEFNDFINYIEILYEEVNEIELIIKVRDIFDAAKELGIEDFINRALNYSKINDNFLDVFNKGLYLILLDYIYNNSQIIRAFDKERYERTLIEFKQNDKTLIKMNVDRIKEILDKKSVDKLRGVGLASQVALLSKENSKKKKLLPLRKFFANTSKLVTTLKPCMMMSPLSVSEYIDPDTVNFDLVIFDEASQICPEDAIGSMIRGKQIIIAGDKKQLPPTKFFNNVSEDTEDYDSEDDCGEDIEDLLGKMEFESILDLASTYMYSTRLLWHYRSRHESLIAFSNKNFYDNTLYTFPSTENNEILGVKFEYVNGRYDQSGSATNIIEAKRVAELVIKHFKENPKKSLGVITFGTKQMDCIQDMVDDMRKNYPELEGNFDEEINNPFFVKNLENVQGDERDTIILSVCYGYSDENRKKINHNFGPINKAGGERRLNVAITRAKNQLILVSSINDSDIDSTRINSIGANLLKEYLYYARVGKMPESIIVDDEVRFESPLEQDIYNEICKLGYQVDTQVGCSGYRIDLAIKNPNKIGNYILGVECDGATYHSSKSARDRDRLRQEVLEGLGWKIHRIWSQDWFKYKKKELNELNKKIKMIICD